MRPSDRGRGSVPVDFVIVAYRSTKDVGRLLLQLALTYTGEHTVTVIDNTRDNRGFAKATNIGAALGNAPIIAFLNPDIILAPGWADGTLAAFADPALVIAGPRLDDGYEWPRDVSSNGITSWVCGACYFVRRDFFESCGGFDERFFFTYEETDLIRQAEARGLRAETIGEPLVKHIRHDTPFHGEQLRISRAQYEQKWGNA